MTKTLYLFVDTNLFLQCRPLDELAWPSMGEVDAIELVLTRPVQAEIDALKGKGNGRQASRARTASTQIRKLLESADNRLQLREASPEVHLWLNPSLRPASEHSGVLDYEHRDDQLVGIALGYRQSNPGALVELLTNDTGPMASAKAVGLPFRDVPESWLLLPEADEWTKREAKLKADLDLYKKQEPEFTVEFGDGEGRKISAEVSSYVALTEEEIEALIAVLREQYPLATEFGETEIRERISQHTGPSALFDAVKEVFTPTTPTEIEQYRQAYDEWIKDCDTKFRALAKALRRREVLPRVSLSIKNSGSRPASDALVVVEAEGHFWLSPPKREDDEAPKADGELGLELSRPPKAPAGRWVQTPLTSIGAALARISAQGRSLGLDIESLTQTKSVSVLPPFLPTPRDPNRLYFKVGSRGEPRARIEYECVQWRHAQAAEDFNFDVWFLPEGGVYAGAVKVVVHAANLTQPARAQLAITINVRAVSCMEKAIAMIDALKDRPASSIRLSRS